MSFTNCRTFLNHTLFICCLIFPAFSIAEDAPKPLSTEAFYQLPKVTNVQLSPDGTHLIALKNVGSTTAVMTYELATGKTFYPAFTDNKKFKINWIRWANNDRILISSRFSDNEFGFNMKVGFTRLFAMDAKKKSKMINMVAPVSDPKFISQFQDNVIGHSLTDPHIIIMGVDDVMPGHQTVYGVDVTNGKRKVIKREDYTIRSWFSDTSGVVRAGEGYNNDNRTVTIKVLDPNTQKWTVAWEYVVFKEPSITPLGFGKNPNELYLLADYKGRDALFKADLSKQGYPKELILSNEAYDITGSLIYSPSVNDVVGLYYNDGEEKSIFWNNDFKNLQASLEKAFPDRNVYLTSFSDNARKYIVLPSNDINPGTVYIGDLDSKDVTPFEDLYPELTENTLIRKEFIKYKARDGLELEGYLSRPKTATGKPLATILFPHGGPMSEDKGGFDQFSAFFVNLGYAVFQPNFRGSSGRGHDFMMQAVGGMGLAMQDDLEDGIKYLIEKKIADPDKLCIVGASYGGYAALMATVKTPELFKCSISFAGISDIKKMRDQSFAYANSSVLIEQFGNDTDQLKKTSPVRSVNKIKTPILLIHGSDDNVVPVEQSRIIADELKKQHKDYEYIELEGGTHRLDYLPHRKQTFEAMEAFLKKYIPVQ